MTGPEKHEAVARFSTWLRRARPGNMFHYHVGLLALDREATAVLDSERADVADALGRAAFWAAKAGLVALVQFRLSTGECLYIAQRTRCRLPNTQ